MVTGLAARATPAQATGGLAVRAWGGHRDLVDLDFYVPESCLPQVTEQFAPWVVRGPERVRSSQWDILVAVLEIGGCRVELGGVDTARYRDAGTGAWHAVDVDFRTGVQREVFGLTIPVVPKEDLVAWKRAMGREVDLVDLHLLTGSGGAVDTRLAAYGTLVPGGVNHAVVADLEGSWTPGIVHGLLQPVGWGTTHGFPALVWRPDGPEVPVQLLTSADLPSAWERLDRFEGEEYQRILVPVTTGEGPVLACLYVARGLT